MKVNVRWRRVRESNPRAACGATIALPMRHLRPLGHCSMFVRTSLPGSHGLQLACQHHDHLSGADRATFLHQSQLALSLETEAAGHTDCRPAGSATLPVWRVLMHTLWK